MTKPTSKGMAAMATSPMLAELEAMHTNPWAQLLPRRVVSASPPPATPDANFSAPAILTAEMLRSVRVPYALRGVPATRFARILEFVDGPRAGDIVLVRLEKIGKNARLELANGRPSALHVGDLLAVVFGNRYATMQFEGYAHSRGDGCDLLSMGGICGVVQSKHDGVADSTKLRILGAIGDADGRPLRLRNFALPKLSLEHRPQLVVVCGTSMDAGKTYTATSLIRGFRAAHTEVAGIKLTGTAAGRDTWGMLDAGACAALDFVDGGFPSTYQVSLEELLELYQLLLAQAAARGAGWVVLEIADGLLQQETAALLRSPAFTREVSAWVFAAGEPLSAAAGVLLLRDWGIEPLAVSGRVTMSQLGTREAEAATGLACVSASELQAGKLVARLEHAAECKRAELGSGGLLGDEQIATRVRV